MKRFFTIMGLPRSGTTAIRTALGEHSEIKTTHEVFNEAYNDDKPFTINQIIDGFGELYTYKKPIIGVHQNFDCPRFNHRKYVWDRLIDISEHLIVVDRPNHVERFISFAFAKRYNHWHDWRSDVTDHNPEKDEPPKELELDLNQFKKFCMNQELQRKQMMRKAKQFKKHIIVDYDIFNASPLGEIERCLNFLGLDNEQLNPQTKKFKRNTRITNINQMKKAYEDFKVFVDEGRASN